MNGRGIEPGDFLGDPHMRSAPALSSCHHSDDLGKEGGFGRADGADIYGAVQDHDARFQPVPGFDSHRHAFTSDH